MNHGVDAMLLTLRKQLKQNSSVIVRRIKLR